MKKTLSTLLTIFTLLCISGAANAQYLREVKGVVKDSYMNEPLIGVSVTVKGSTIGTVTDLDGNFTLRLTDPNQKTLTVSYIGYKSQDVTITDSFMTIKLEEEQMLLEEVVVIAYGAQRKSSLAGSISSVSVSQVNNKDSKSKTWKRSGMSDNSIRLEVGADDFIPLEAAQMSVQVDGFRVRVLLDCFFYNNKGSGLEGVFKLKLPTEATPYYMAFGETLYFNEEDDDDDEVKLPSKEKRFPFANYKLDAFNLAYQNIVDDSDDYWSRVKEARIVSKQKAAKAYEQTVGAKIDPALMEWGGADMFSCKVFPLANNTLHRVVIGYDLTMTEALDFREYILTLPKVEKDLKLDIVMYHSPNMPVAIAPAVDAVEKSANRVYYSVSNPKEKEFTITYNTVAPVMIVQASEPEDSRLAESIDIPYFAANYKVSLPETLQENLPQDAVFILDASISSNPDKFNVWLKLIDEVLDKNRDIIKRFAVLTFNIDDKWYRPYFQKNDYYNKQMFLEYANTLALEGATDLSLALQEASSPSWVKKGNNKPKHIFLMSDGDCNWGETNMYKFAELVNKGDRIHTYKTGLSGTNTAVLNYLSKQTNGFAFTVTGEEEAELTAKSFRYKPWNIVDIKMSPVEEEGNDEVEDFLISGNPTQLYNGQKLIFTGRQIPQKGFTITVNNGTETKQLVYTAAERINSTLASRVYGQIASSYLDSYGFKAEDAAVNYSTYYRVPGVYTSFLMLESSWDYDSFGIEDDDASDFVEENLVKTLTAAFEEMGATTIAGSPKEDFVAWIERLKDGDVSLDVEEEFETYLKSIPAENFTVNRKTRRFGVHLASEQTDDEAELLADDDVRFERLIKLARKRIPSYGKPSALRLLSSAIERNAADIQLMRDVSMTALDWGMGEHAYYVMKRLMDWRQEDALAYLTAAEALASTGSNVDLALIYYYICLNVSWNSDFGNVRDVAALKCRGYLKELKALPTKNLTAEARVFVEYLDASAEEILENGSFGNSLEADVLIVVSWNLDDTDIDLHIVEPTDEVCYYSNKQTKIGGQMSSDVTNGFGPEMYILRKATAGKYKIKLDYYSSSGTKTASKPKSYIDVYRNWGRKNQEMTRKVVELSRFNDYYQSDEEEEKNKTVLEFTIKE